LLYVSLRTGLAALIVTVALSGCAATQVQADSSNMADMPMASAPAHDASHPSMVVTDDQTDVIYRRGTRDTDFSTGDAIASMSSLNTQHIETVVTRKAIELNHDLEQLQEGVENSSSQLRRLQAKHEGGSAEYFAIVAGISAELQSGTTAGNPILIDRWNLAQSKLNALAQDEGALNVLAADLADQASRSTFLLNAVDSAFALSGAVKEDHKKLTAIQDGINQIVPVISRLLTKTNDEIARRTNYMRTERANLQALFLGISNGELYGESLTNNLYKKATSEGQILKPGMDGKSSDASSTRRPLVVIRFDRPNVNYEQPLYTAISQALEKYPMAKFDLVAVSNNDGNPAQIALSSAEARKNGEAVLRSLAQMGLPLERVHLSAATSKDVANSEVHLYIQ